MIENATREDKLLTKKLENLRDANDALREENKQKEKKMATEIDAIKAQNSAEMDKLRSEKDKTNKEREDALGKLSQLEIENAKLKADKGSQKSDALKEAKAEHKQWRGYHTFQRNVARWHRGSCGKLHHLRQSVVARLNRGVV